MTRVGHLDLHWSQSVASHRVVWCTSQYRVSSRAYVIALTHTIKPLHLYCHRFLLGVILTHRSKQITWKVGVVLYASGKCVEGVEVDLRGVEGRLKYRAQLTMFVLYIGSLFEPVIFLNEILPRGPLQNSYHFLLRPQWSLARIFPALLVQRSSEALRVTLRLKITSHSPFNPKLPTIHNLQRSKITLRLGSWGPMIAREIFL